MSGNTNEVGTVLSQMESIGLDDMKSVRLMNRVDQKYIAPRSALPQLLEYIAQGYFVQHIAGEPIAPYRTLYFDTENLAMYLAHHNTKLNRQKIRVRTYRSTDTTFFEIKNKDNKRKTRKLRIPLPVEQFDQCLDNPDVVDFIQKNTPYPISDLIPCLENHFHRITLVDKMMTERITIDSDINFHNQATNVDAEIEQLLVIEVKHEVGAPISLIENMLHEMKIQPRRMSKYCIGTALTTQGVKHNRFKEKLLAIEKIRSLESKDSSNFKV